MSDPLNNNSLIKPYNSTKPGKLHIVWVFVIILIVIVLLVVLFIWMQGRHKQQCTTNKDCANGETCQQNRCVPSSNSGCTSNTDCPSGETCINGVCKKPIAVNCTENNQCPSGQVCDLTINQCVAGTGGGVGTHCDKTAGCNNGLYCSGANTCQNSSNYNAKSCSNDTQCQVGNHCDATSKTCVSDTGGNPGQSCDAQNPCRSDSFCSSVNICHQGVPKQANEACQQATQCGTIGDTTYYCNFIQSSSTCSSARQLTASTIASSGFNPAYLSIPSNQYPYTPSRIGQLLSTPSAKLLSGNTQLVYPYFNASPAIKIESFTINASPTTGIVGPNYSDINFNVDPSGLLVSNNQPSKVYLYNYNTTFNDPTTKYIVIDQYGNPLLYSTNTSLSTTRGVLGFYDPVNYPGQLVSPAFGFVPVILSVS